MHTRRQPFFTASTSAGVLLNMPTPSFHSFSFSIRYGQPWFGGNSGVPVNNTMQENEIRHQLRRLGHHPCIAVLNSCNECGGGKLWGSFVSPTMANEEPSRPIWPASPSIGWESGVDTLTGLPNGKPLVLKQQQQQQQQQEVGVVAKEADAAEEESALQQQRQQRQQEYRSSNPEGTTCTAERDVDYGKGVIWKSVLTPEPGDCCAACVAQEGCVVGLWYVVTLYPQTCNNYINLEFNQFEIQRTLEIGKTKILL